MFKRSFFHKLSPILALTILLSFRPALAAQQPLDLSELEKIALAEIKETNTPGAAVAVVSGDQVVFAGGFGVASVETSAPITSNMLFQIGSMTKTFTAAAVVTLAEEGKIKLDAPIGSYVTGLSPKLSQVTLHQLLSHTAGLKDEPDEYGLHDETALANYMHSWKDDYCLLEPGQVFSYSNSGVALAGFVMQEVVGKLYADHMSESLFKPLGMNRTTFRPTMAMTYPLAPGHRAQGKEKPTVVRPLADDSRLWPAGTMYSSINDLARFAIAFLNGGKIEGKQVLLPSVITQLSTPRVEIPSFVDDTQYGYCLWINEHRGVCQVGHDGAMTGYVATLKMAPEHRFAVIILANKDNGWLPKTLEKALELMLPLAAKSEVKPKPALPMNAAEMRRYVGVYANPNRWTAEILMRDRKLVLKQFGAELPITKIGDSRFSVQPPNASQPQEFVIGLGADGNPAYLHQLVWAFKKEK